MSLTTRAWTLCAVIVWATVTNEVFAGQLITPGRMTSPIVALSNAGMERVTE